MMQLGCFSISLTVADLKNSRAFYEKIGFEVFAGEEAHHYLIMKNGDANIGLFQDMLESNILTFNPGWNQYAEPIKSFKDVHQLRKAFESAGIELGHNPEIEGATSFTIVDPDGNTILIDQHVSQNSQY